jgi:hypothetical protein
MKELEMIGKIKNVRLQTEVLNDFSLDDCLYKGIREIALNTINRNIPLTRLQKEKLIKYKPHISKFVCKAQTKKSQRKQVTQSGGFLQILVPIVASLLAHGAFEKSGSHAN